MTRREPNPAKTAARDQILTARRRLSVAQIRHAATGLAEVAQATSAVRRAATVAAYVAIGAEPGTGPLLDALVEAGTRVIVPVLLPDNDLDWAQYTGDLVSARRGLLEPPGPLLGLDAIATADLVIVPGLGVSAAGDRLGRGGGSYDRALARVPVGTDVWIALYPNEVGIAVPVEPHDRPVTGALTSHGVTLFT